MLYLCDNNALKGILSLKMFGLKFCSVKLKTQIDVSKTLSFCIYDVSSYDVPLNYL